MTRYLADGARYSDTAYAFCPRHPDRTERQLLLVRAAVGEAHVRAVVSAPLLCKRVKQRRCVRKVRYCYAGAV